MISGVGGLMLLDLEGDVVTSIGQPTHFDLDEFLKQCYLKGDYKGTKMFTYNLVSYKYVSYNDWYLISSTPNTYILSEVLKVVKSLFNWHYSFDFHRNFDFVFAVAKYY